MTATADVTAGTLDVADLYSAANGRRFAVWTWVPPGEGPFPLVVLLHGVYDSGGQGWWLRARAHEAALALPAPPVLVMAPDTGAELGTAYADWADGTTYAETFVVDELLAWTRTELPVAGRPGVTGNSMGGYGALLLALRHPGLFASATGTSAFFAPERLFDYVADERDRIWGDDAGRDAHDVARLLAELGATAGLRIAFDCGTGDALIEDNRRMHARLDAAGVPHGYAEHDGGHDWEYWRRHVGDHLRFHAGLPSPLSGGAA